MTLDLDFTYILVLALFLVPLVMLNALVIKPFLKLFHERHEKLEGATKRAEEVLLQSESRARDLEAKINVATGAGLEARSRIRSEAEREMTVRLENQKQRLQGRVDEALKEIEAKRNSALTQITEDARQMAEMTASKLLGRAI